MEKEIRAIIRKHRNILIPVSLVFASFFIIMRIIMPQLDTISELNSNIIKKSSDIEAASKLYEALSTLPESVLADDYDIAVRAVPIEKDLTLMFTSLTDAAGKSNVELGGFTLNVGGVYDSTNSYKNEKQIDGIPYLNIIVSATGNETNLISFGQALYKTLPLIQINSIQIHDGRGNFDVNFYFKPIKALQIVKEGNNIEGLTSAESALLKEFSSWK